MFLYYITDRKQFPGTEREQRSALLQRISEAADVAVDFVQLREKDLAAAELEKLASEALAAVRDHSKTTRLLINSRTDVALAVGADGVHLTSNDIAASEARAVWSAAGFKSASFVVSVSCHSVRDVRLAESHGADLVVLAPIFGKTGTNLKPLGVGVLSQASLQGVPADRRVEAGDHRTGVPVLALGGVTLQNASDCLRAGVAGIAGIRLFQEGSIRTTVAQLRELR